MDGLRRRTLLTGIALAGAANSTGCLGNTQEALAPDDRDENEPELPGSCPDPEKATEFHCGAAPPISTTHDLGDDPDVVDNGNGTVDVVMAKNRDEAFYRTFEFEEWARIGAGRTGGHAAIDHVRAELDDLTGLGMGIGGPGQETGASFRVTDVDGRVSIVAVVEAAPAFVETTVTLGDREYYTDVPVYVHLDVQPPPTLD